MKRTLSAVLALVALAARPDAAVRTGPCPPDRGMPMWIAADGMAWENKQAYLLLFNPDAEPIAVQTRLVVDGKKPVLVRSDVLGPWERRPIHLNAWLARQPYPALDGMKTFTFATQVVCAGCGASLAIWDNAYSFATYVPMQQACYDEAMIVTVRPQP